MTMARSVYCVLRCIGCLCTVIILNPHSTLHNPLTWKYMMVIRGRSIKRFGGALRKCLAEKFGLLIFMRCQLSAFQAEKYYYLRFVLIRLLQNYYLQYNY